MKTAIRLHMCLDKGSVRDLTRIKRYYQKQHGVVAERSMIIRRALEELRSGLEGGRIAGEPERILAQHKPRGRKPGCKPNVIVRAGRQA